MGSKILAWAGMLMSFGVMVTLGITTLIISAQTNWQANNILFVWLASLAICLLALRFDITALRHDLTERMTMPNVGLIIVSLFLFYYFLQDMIPGFDSPVVMYSVIGGLVGAFILVFVLYWVWGKKRNA